MVNREKEFSLWLDFVERDFLQGEFKRLIQEGVINGATSNPAIFSASMTHSLAYQAQLEGLKGKSPKEKYEALAIEDIRMAAQALKGCYDEGNDGYISLEVDPFLSNNTQATIEEGRRLYAQIDHENVMIKIPATHAGYEAMKTLLSEGISVNATLVFSPKQAKRCLKAMREGIALSSRRVDAVISVFVSRFDRLLDPQLLQEGIVDVAKTGIYNAGLIYQLIESADEPHIRTLFASTGVKGDTLEADYYIRELYAPHSVNTAPLTTIQSYIQKPQTTTPLPLDEAVIQGYFTKLSDYGFDMEEISQTLLKEGLVAFEEAFSTLLKTLEEKE